MAFFNQNSLLIMLVMGFIIVAAGLWRWQGRSVLLRMGIAAWYVFAALLVVLAVQYPTPDGTPRTVADIEAALNNGQPTVVMLYSDY